MEDTFKNELNIGDNVIFMIQHYDGRWDSFHKGIIIGFTPCFVKIQIADEEPMEGETTQKDGIYSCKFRLVRERKNANKK